MLAAEKKTCKGRINYRWKQMENKFHVWNSFCTFVCHSKTKNIYLKRIVVWIYVCTSVGVGVGVGVRGGVCVCGRLCVYIAPAHRRWDIYMKKGYNFHVLRVSPVRPHFHPTLPLEFLSTFDIFHIASNWNAQNGIKTVDRYCNKY